MPEAVEIFHQTEWLKSKIGDKEFYGIKNCGKYKINLDDFVSSFRKPMQRITCKGKVFFLRFADISVIIHHKMGGYFTDKKDKHTQVVFYFRNKGEKKKTGMTITKIYLVNTRFGNFDVCNFDEEEKNIKKLENGFLGDFVLSEKRWLKNFDKFADSKIIAEALLGQDVKGSNKGLASGIGNFLRAEILYDAKIHPRTIIGNLTNDDRIIIYNSCIRVINRYLEKYRLDSPNGEILDYSKKNHLIYNQKEDPNGYKVRTSKDSKKRMMYWVSEIQK